MSRQTEAKPPRWITKYVVPAGVIVSLILGLYSLIDKGFFSSMVISPAQFNQIVEKLNDYENKIIMLETRIDYLERRLRRNYMDKDRTSIPEENSIMLAPYMITIEERSP